MELMLIILGILLILLFCVIPSHDFTDVVWSSIAVTIGLIIMFLITDGRTISLNTNTNYTVKEIYYSNESVVLELKDSNWIDTYTYKAVCSEIKNGCPKPWPKKFKTVKDGKQYIIIPIESENEQ